MSKRKKLLLACLGTLAALIIFLIALLPLIVRHKAIALISEETGRKAHIESISINPFTLTVTVKGLALEAQDSGPFISVASLRAALSMSSIYRRALILSEVAIEAPAISFARLEANKYSFNDIIERQNKKPKQAPKGEFHYSINNISLDNGSLDFDDRAVNGGRKHTIRQLKVTVPFISNIPFLVEKYTNPHISALVNDAPFNFDGRTKPLSKSMETSVHIHLKQLNLPGYVTYSPVKPPADLASGLLSIDTEVTYRVSSDKKPELGLNGRITFEELAVNLKNGQPLLKLPLFQLQTSQLEVFSRHFLFDTIAIKGLELFVNRDARGVWMYQQLLPSPQADGQTASPSQPSAAPSGQAKPLVQIAAFTFSDGLVHFRDAQPAGGFKSEISQIDAEVRNFSTADDKSADYELSLLLDNEASLTVDGTFSLSPLSATVSSELDSLKIQRGWPYMAAFLTAPVKGTLNLSAEASFSNDQGLSVTRGKLSLADLSTRYGDNERFDLSRFDINNAAFNQKSNSVEISEIRLSKGSFTASRETDGSFSPLSLLKKPAATPPQSVTTAPPLSPAAVTETAPVKPGSKQFTFRVNKFLIDKFSTAVTDKSRREKPVFPLADISLQLNNISGPQFAPLGLIFSSTFNRDTPLKASGEIMPQPLRYKGNVSVGRLPLRDFEAYFPTNINVFLISGSADTSLDVDIALKEGKPVGSFKGSAGIRGLHTVDTLTEEDLLKWESLQLDGIQGNLEPFSLTLRDIALTGLYSRIIIRKDGVLNLQTLVEKPEKEGQSKPDQAPQAAAAPAPAPASAPAAGDLARKAAPRQISIGAVTLQGGTVAFSDNHLPQKFSATFYNLGGRVSGLSSDEAKFADVDLRGNLENHSPLQITGQINPLRDDLFVNLKLSFRDIELSPATPYSGRFLGYAIEKGKLFLDLSYHIENKQLTSENKVFIDQFTFGEKVESDKATRLPVKLGLALLKDRRGEIHLDLPVTGRTDDPKFSIWGIVWQVVKNVLMKAVTSPFALLSSMFGGSQDFSAVHFTAGSSELAPAEEQKLGALAKALLERPALKVELKGYVDRERDSEGYRNELLLRKLRHEKFIALSKAGTVTAGDKEENIQLLPEEQITYLTPVYRKEKFPKPRNAIGLVKELPPGEMKKLIMTNTVIGDAELQTLAHERVTAVKSYLATKGSVPPERVFEKNDNLFKAPEKADTSPSRVELNAIAQ